MPVSLFEIYIHGHDFTTWVYYICSYTTIRLNAKVLQLYFSYDSAILIVLYIAEYFICRGFQAVEELENMHIHTYNKSDFRNIELILKRNFEHIIESTYIC